MDITNKAEMAKLLRETADLVERGMVTLMSVEVDYDAADTNWHGIKAKVSTGYQTLRLELAGNPQDLNTREWYGQLAIGGPQRMLK